MIKRFIIAIILLVLVCGGLVGFNIMRDKGIQQYFATMKAPPATVSAVAVKPMSWKPGIAAIGTVSASKGVDVAVETGGIVKTINFKANQDIEQGELLLQLDDAVERADLAAAQSSLKLAQDTLKRTQALSERGVSATSSLDSAAAEATSAQSTVERLSAVLRQKQLNAPFAGTIGIPKVEVGQYITAGTAVATLQALQTMRVDFTIPEQEFPNLKLGQPVTAGFTSDALEFAGKITGIDPKIDPTSRLVSVRAEVDNASSRLRPGQFVQVRVELPEEKDIIAIPQTALTSSLYGDFVFIVRKKSELDAARAADAAKASGQDAAAKPAEGATPAAAANPDGAGDEEVAAQVFVKVGRRDGQLVEITNGVQAGDQVITAGQNRLTNGATVTIDNTVNPADAALKEAGL